MLLLAISAAAAADFYVDPVTGSPGGDGSAAAPWRTLQEVVDDGLIAADEWDGYPWDSSRTLVPRNAGAPVSAGDRILLRSGYHGEVSLSRHYADPPIVVAAEDGHTPTAGFVHLESVGGFELRGLSLGPLHSGSGSTETILSVADHSWSGPAWDVVLADNTVASIADSSAWTAADWNARAADGIFASGTRIEIRDNRLTNVDFGISVTATHSLVDGNLVENFSGDGLRGLGDHTTFQYNTVRNSYDVNDNHDDGFQSWSTGPGGVGTGEVVGIVLRGNVIVNRTDPAQPHAGPLQGIGCFDGTFVDWVVENNVIRTDHWHGITLLGARNATVVNNTVVDINEDSPGPPWISVNPHKDGTLSTGSVVRNNLTTALNIDAGQDVVEDHNLLVAELDEHFVDADAGDLHLRADSPAIDAGSETGAPATDAEGVARPQGSGVDVGAYERPVACADAGGVCCDAGETCTGALGAAGDCADCCIGGVCVAETTGHTGTCATCDTASTPAASDPDSAATDGGCGCAAGGGRSGMSALLMRRR